MLLGRAELFLIGGAEGDPPQAAAAGSHLWAENDGQLRPSLALVALSSLPLALRPFFFW